MSTMSYYSFQPLDPSSTTITTDLSDLKTMTLSIQELPSTTMEEMKPPAKVLLAPALPYDERLRKFLERPSAQKKTSQYNDDTSSTYSSTTAVERKQSVATASTLADETPAVAVSQIKEEGERVPRDHLSRRERLKEWWVKEKAEQKAFRNAMGPYFAF